MKLAEIKNECKKYGVKSTGTKDKLLQRIKIAKFHMDQSQKSVPVLIRKWNEKQFVQVMTFDKFFSLVFENDRVVGKMDNRDESFSYLTKKDIEYCKELNLSYIIPSVLIGEHQTHRIKHVIEYESDEEDD